MAFFYGELDFPAQLVCLPEKERKRKKRKRQRKERERKEKEKETGILFFGSFI